MKLNVLIACEESQRECFEFRKLGHNAYSCDIQPCRKRGGNPSWHIHDDVTKYLVGSNLKFYTQDGSYHLISHWDLIVAHPPCTYLCKVSSVQLIAKKPYSWQPPNKNWTYSPTNGYWFDGVRLRKMHLAASFFYRCLSADAPFVAVENPLPMKRAGLPRPSCYVQPSWFGEKYTKKTCYWLKNLPPLMPTLIYPNPTVDFCHHSRGKYRSVTFKGIANAMAIQWSNFIENEYETTMHQY